MCHRRRHPQPCLPLSWVRTRPWAPASASRAVALAARHRRREAVWCPRPLRPAPTGRAVLTPAASPPVGDDVASSRRRRGHGGRGAMGIQSMARIDVDAIGDEAARSCSAPVFPSPHSHSLIAQTLASLMTCSRAQL